MCRKVLGVLLLGILSWGLCAAEPIKIGALLPLSPPGSYASGEEMKWAMEIALEEINAAGGLLGRPVELIIADTRGLPEEAAAATERLITREGVVAIVGNFHSSCALAAMPIVHKYHIPYIGAEPWADELTASGYPEIFRITVSNSMYSKVVADWIIAAGFKNIVAMVENTDWGLGAWDALVPWLEKAGVQYERAVADLTEEDFTPQLLRWKSMKPRPELFLGWMTGPAAYRLLNQSKEIGFAPTPETLYKGESPVLFPEFWENCGENGLYVIMHEIGLPESAFNDKTRAFVAAFQAKHGRTPTSLGMEGYDSLALMAEAIKQAGSTDPDAIIDALENIHWVGVQGEYYFTYTSKNPVPPDMPAWLWHQWEEVPMILRQYSKVGQSHIDAPIIWPRKFSTLLYIPVPECAK